MPQACRSGFEKAKPSGGPVFNLAVAFQHPKAKFGCGSQAGKPLLNIQMGVAQN